MVDGEALLGLINIYTLFVLCFFLYWMQLYIRNEKYTVNFITNAVADENDDESSHK